MLRLLAALIASMGCGAKTVVVQVPFEERHLSAVVSVEHRGDVNLYAVDTASRNMQPILRSIEDWNDEDPIGLRMVRYEQTLEEIGLPGPGKLTPATFGRSLSIGEVLERTVDENGLGEWTASSNWPDVFRDFRFGDPCRPIQAAFRDPTPSDVVRFAGVIPRPDGTAIFVARTAFERPIFFRVTTAGAERLDVTFDHRVSFAFLGNDQRIYLMGGDANPMIYAGDPDSGFGTFTETPAPQGSWPHWSVMTESGVIFAAGPSGEIYRIQGSEWALAHRFAVQEFNQSVSLTAVGPEELYVVDPDGYSLNHYFDGEVTAEQTEIDAELAAHTDRLTVVKHVAGVGTFAGTNEGIVLRRDPDGRWRLIQNSLVLGREIWAIEKFDGGVLIGGFYGILDQFYPDTGFCEDTRFRGGNDLSLQQLALIDGGIAMTGYRLVSEGVQELFVGALTLE
jgi:hypothetical protein